MLVSDKLTKIISKAEVREFIDLGTKVRTVLFLYKCPYSHTKLTEEEFGEFGICSINTLLSQYLPIGYLIRVPQSAHIMLNNKQISISPKRNQEIPSNPKKIKEGPSITIYGDLESQRIFIASSTPTVIDMSKVN